MAKAALDVRRIVEEYIARLRPEIRVEKAILFGSHPRGTASEWSDIDIAIISNDFKKMKPLEQVEFLALRRRGCDPALEPLAFTLDEYEAADPLTFLGEIKRTGVVIFETMHLPKADR